MSEPDDLTKHAAGIEDSDDIPVSPSNRETIGDVIARRYNRRDIVKGALGVTAVGAVFGTTVLAGCTPEDVVETDPKKFAPKGFGFSELEAGVDADDHVASGYTKKVLLRWGDEISPDSPAFDPYRQTPGAQNKQFGYNNDYVAYFPLDENGDFVEGEQTDAGNERGLLCVNHEYVTPTMMFPDVKPSSDEEHLSSIRDWMVDVEMAAVGVTIVEIEKDGDTWQVVHNSPRNRRITANTPMTVDGPVLEKEEQDNYDRLEHLRTKYDDSGLALLGTSANCAGGRTPWGTYLTAEENIQYLFTAWVKGPDGMLIPKPKSEPKRDPISASGSAPLETASEDAEADDTDRQMKERQRRYKRYKIGDKKAAWGREYPRFNIEKEPNEPNRFGWIVEIDPFDPNSTPVKHTALGRFFHEGAETVLSKDDRAVVFSGDDTKFEYVYRFVSDGTYKRGDKEANMGLLSKGTLSVARFDDTGRGEWIPLEHGDGELAKNDTTGAFRHQADVVIYARLAADEVKATAMDRPEDVQPNPETKRVYVMLTNNSSRVLDAYDEPSKDPRDKTVNEANPRPHNLFGHIIEIIPDGLDFASPGFSWDILVACGDPARPSLRTKWGPGTSKDGWFTCPDNAAVDSQGRLWIATDQGDYWQRTMRADGLYGLETHGAAKASGKDGRGTPRMFYRVPIGAELCGPCFTPNGETLFVAVQHPGSDGMSGVHDIAISEQHKDLPKFRSDEDASFSNPGTRWPDFDKDMPPRPSVVVITKDGGGKIGD